MAYVTAIANLYLQFVLFAISSKLLDLIPEYKSIITTLKTI